MPEERPCGPDPPLEKSRLQDLPAQPVNETHHQITQCRR